MWKTIVKKLENLINKSFISGDYFDEKGNYCAVEALVKVSSALDLEQVFKKSKTIQSLYEDHSSVENLIKKSGISLTDICAIQDINDSYVPRIDSPIVNRERYQKVLEYAKDKASKE